MTAMTTEQRQAATQARADAMAAEPGREGSTSALAVLRLLCAQPDTGMAWGQLLTVSGLSRRELAAAIKGLQARGRICCLGRGLGAAWFTKVHFARLQGGLA